MRGLMAAGLGGALAVMALGLVGPLALPLYCPVESAAPLLPPSAAHIFGTDLLGRDLLSRLAGGARTSLLIALGAMGLSCSLGLVVGGVAGLAGGWVDRGLMALADFMLALPRLVLLLAVVAMLQGAGGILALVLVLALTGWMTPARLLRSEVRAASSQEHVLACRALGFSPARILLRHVLPQAAGPLIVHAVLGVGSVMLVEAGLSYLGLGVPPPTPAWGSMVAEGRHLLHSAWWVSTFPGLAIALTVSAFALLGEALRQRLTPGGHPFQGRGRWW